MPSFVTPPRPERGFFVFGSWFRHIEALMREAAFQQFACRLPGTGRRMARRPPRGRRWVITS
jgi:hypothetical protein